MTLAKKNGAFMDKQRSITKEQLMDLIKKYKIGKKPLSKLLGWGETTVLLYRRATALRWMKREN